MNIRAINKGIRNFRKPKKEVEEKARQRLEKMKKCPNFQKEKISFLRVNDKRIPGLSGMCCKECGCVMSYKARQDEEKCACWNEGK